MYTLSMIVAMLTLPLALFGLVNVVKPLGLLRIRRRRHGAAIVGGAVVIFIVAALIGGANEPPEIKAQREAEAKAAEERSRAGAAVPTGAVKLKEAPPEGVTQIEFNAVWGAAKVVMERCDAPVRRAGDVVGTGDVYAAYPLVQRAEQDCNQAMMLMRDIEPPKSAKGEVRKAIIEARDACATTAFIKGYAMKKLAKVLDGDTRPSAFADAKAELERGQLSNLQCVAKFAAAAEAAGVTLPELDQDTDARPS